MESSISIQGSLLTVNMPLGKYLPFSKQEVNILILGPKAKDFTLLNKDDSQFEKFKYYV